LFGKDVAPNLFIVATFCDASEPPVKACLRAADIDSSKFFTFNNSAVFEDYHGKNDVGQAFQTFYWNAGQASFKDFFTQLQKTTPVSLSLSVEVLQRRQQLESLVVDMQESIKHGIIQLERLRQEAMIMETYEAQIKVNESFTYTIKESKIIHCDISGMGIYTTTCLTCNFTCHRHCAYADDKDKAQCIAMDTSAGSCKVCPLKCPWNMHKNLPYICQIVEEEVTKTDEDLRKKYLKATDDKKSKEMMIENLGRMFAEQQRNNCHTVSQIRENVCKLQVR
jgi:hypothetical protein